MIHFAYMDGASGLGSEGWIACGIFPPHPLLHSPLNHETAVSGVFSAVVQTSLAVSFNKIV